MDDPLLDVQFHQVSRKGTTSVGVNIRTVNGIDRALLTDSRIKCYGFGDDKDACVMDLMGADEIMSASCAGQCLN